MKSSIAPAFRGSRRSARARQALAGTLSVLVLLAAGPSARAQETTATEPAAARAEPGREQAQAIARVRDLLGRKRPRDAAAAAEDSLARFPGNPQLRFLYGVALADSERTDDAIAVFQQLNREHPELAEPYNNLAVLLAGQGRLEQARNALEQAVRAVPDYGLAYENLGDVYLRLAQEAYERAGSVAKPSAAARRKLGLVRELATRISP